MTPRLFNLFFWVALLAILFVGVANIVVDITKAFGFSFHVFYILDRGWGYGIMMILIAPIAIRIYFELLLILFRILSGLARKLNL